MKINFGAGNRHEEGYVNLDKEQLDLNKLPYNFDAGSVDEINCCHVLEHLDAKPSEVMNEFLRILKDDGVIKIQVPHFSWHNAYDEDHERFFNTNSFSFMHKTNIEKEVYNYITREVKVGFYKGWRFWEYPAEWLINSNRHIMMVWESTFLVNLFTANQIFFEIRKVRT